MLKKVVHVNNSCLYSELREVMLIAVTIGWIKVWRLLFNLGGAFQRAETKLSNIKIIRHENYPCSYRFV